VPEQTWRYDRATRRLMVIARIDGPCATAEGEQNIVHYACRLLPDRGQQWTLTGQGAIMGGTPRLGCWQNSDDQHVRFSDCRAVLDRWQAVPAP
jgi:hypothetical protein